MNTVFEKWVFAVAFLTLQKVSVAFKADIFFVQKDHTFYTCCIESDFYVALKKSIYPVEWWWQRRLTQELKASQCSPLG